MLSFRKTVLSALFACALMFAATPAHAGFVLFIADNAATTPGAPSGDFVFVPDNGAEDGSGATGAITIQGSSGVWTFVLSSGLSDPILSAPYPHMDLNFQVASSAAGSLTIWLTDTDFTTSPATFTGSFGGTAGTGASITGTAYRGSGNGEFGTAQTLFTCGPFGAGPYACSQTSGSFSGGPYSVTQRIQITHTGAGVSSGDFELTTSAVPEPASMLLFGTGLVGLANRVRRNRKSRQ